jgi:hypothetical protein
MQTTLASSILFACGIAAASSLANMVSLLDSCHSGLFSLLK